MSQPDYTEKTPSTGPWTEGLAIAAAELLARTRYTWIVAKQETDPIIGHEESLSRAMESGRHFLRRFIDPPERPAQLIIVDGMGQFVYGEREMARERGGR